LGLLSRESRADKLIDVHIVQLSHNEPSPSHTNAYLCAAVLLSKGELGKMHDYSVDAGFILCLLMTRPVYIFRTHAHTQQYL